MQRTLDRTQRNGALALLAATLLYGSMSVLSRYVGYQLPLFYQNVTREVFAFLLVCWSVYQWKPLAKKDVGWLIFRSLAGATSFLLYFTAINAMPIGTTYFIFYSGLVVGGFAVGQAVFREHITPIRIISLVLAAIGLLLVYGFSFSGTNPIPMILALGSGLCTTVWNTIAKKIEGYSPLQLTAIDCAFTSGIYLTLSLASGEIWPVFALTPVMMASLLIGAFFVFTGLLVVYGFSRLEVQLASLIMLAEILFAILFGYMIYREMPAPTATLGGICILIAMMLPEMNWEVIKAKIYAYRR